MAILKSLYVLGSFLSFAQSKYTLRKTYDASNFFDENSFTFYNGYDVFNKGFTTYVGKAEALASGLASITSDNKVFLGMDYTTKLTVAPNAGRKSIRLTGSSAFTTGLWVGDIQRMPASVCGVWNAYWLVRDGKGSFAEVDMAEGVYSQTTWMNAYTMFEGQCQMTDGGGTDKPWATNCKLDPGPGCHANGPVGSFGDSFNAQNGGFFATQVEADGVKIWFFKRGSQPADIQAANPDTSKWGPPVMFLAPVNCDINTIFRQLTLVLNTLTCGTVNSWQSSGCSAKTGYSTCEAYVAANPAVFKEAYYLVNSIKVYQDDVRVPATPATPTPTLTPTLPNAPVCPPAATTCGNVGMQFAIQQHSYTHANGFNVDPNFFKSAPSVYQGFTTQSGFDSGYSSTGSIYGAPNMDLGPLAIHGRGYIYAKVAGVYTFSVDKFDDRVFVWTGQIASSNDWNTNNARLVRNYAIDAPGSFTMNLAACSYTPYRVLGVNGGGPMALQFTVTDPLGNQIMGPNSSPTDAILEFSCDGTTAPKYSAYGAEGVAASSPAASSASATPALSKSPVCPLAATTCGNVGMQFAIQQHSYTHANGFNVDPNFFKSAPSVYQGFTTQSGFDSGYSSTGSIYGAPNMDLGPLAIHGRGYIYAKVAGVYTFSVDKFDDRVFVWTGQIASSNDWNTNNARLVRNYAIDAPGSFTMNLAACSYTPYRVLGVNGGGPMALQFTVTDPLGNQIMGPNSSPTDAILQFSCDVTAAPKYSAYGAEGVAASSPAASSAVVTPPTVGTTPAANCAAPTTCGNTGMDFALQYHPWYDWDVDGPLQSTVVNPEYFKTDATAYTGNTASSLFMSDGSAAPFFGSPTMSPNMIAIHHRGYIYAKYSGTYTITVDLSDNQVLVWAGANALTGWNRSNAQISAQLHTTPTGKYTVNLAACQYLPLRVIGINGNGPMTFQYTVTDPSGTQLMGPNTASNAGIVKFGCGNDAKSAPQYSSWGKEQ